MRMTRVKYNGTNNIPEHATYPSHQNGDSHNPSQSVRVASLLTMGHHLPLAAFFLFFSLHAALSLHTALLAPIAKDPFTLQYTATIYLKTPPHPTKLLLDLGGSVTWLHWSKLHDSSSSFLPIPCNSSLCNALNFKTCSNNSCALFPENPLTGSGAVDQALIGVLAAPVTDGRNPGPLASISNFSFSGAPTQLLKGLAKGLSGLAALGRSKFSLPSQVSDGRGSPHVFAICLSGSASAPGVAFLGTAGPYVFHPEVDLANSLIYTPLLLNPVSDAVITYAGLPSDEYFIGVRSVKVNGIEVAINDTLLSIDENGYGGTKISTVEPYTKMKSSIHAAFVEAFIREAAGLNLTKAKQPEEPFTVCFAVDDVDMTRVGPAVPTVDLVMGDGGDGVFWRMFGANLMVRMDDVWCLGFVDGGPEARTSIVIGGYQMEDNLVQIDMEGKRFGFSSTLLLKQTMCGNFNFTCNGQL